LKNFYHEPTRTTRKEEEKNLPRSKEEGKRRHGGKREKDKLIIKQVELVF